MKTSRLVLLNVYFVGSCVEENENYGEHTMMKKKTTIQIAELLTTKAGQLIYRVFVEWSTYCDEYAVYMFSIRTLSGVLSLLFSENLVSAVVVSFHGAESPDLQED